MMHALDEANIEHSINNAGANKHIKLWALEGCWKKASLPGPKQKTKDKIFQARMFSKSLPTPRNVQVTNEAKFPKLYPGCKCPICDANDVGDDFHIFCKCPAVAGIRRLATHNVKKQIDKTIGAHDSIVNQEIPARLIRAIFTPNTRARFRHGHVDARMKEWAETVYDQETIEKWVHKIQPIFVKAYRQIWNAYTDDMANKGKNFAQRLKDEYNGLKPSDMKNFENQTG
jgi:hypothetical protein